jgi:YjjG family noncanonical pyrimidine nucleotidase
VADLRTDRFSQLFERLAIKTDVQQFSNTYLHFLGQATDLIPGALETLQALSGQYRMVIITNGISQVQRSRLSLSPIKAYFEDIFISEEIGVSKPAGPYFDAVFAGIGHPPRESVLVIGDSLSSDMRGGINFGLDTCWFNPDGIQKPADMPINHEIKNLGQLLDILKI